MGINFAAASTAGLNNPGTEIITLVKDAGGSFINPPSYDKMLAYLRSGDVPCLFVTNEADTTGDIYQFSGYSEIENKIRFIGEKTAIEFSAGSDMPVISDVGGGGGGGGGFDFVITIDASGGTHYLASGSFSGIKEKLLAMQPVLGAFAVDTHGTSAQTSIMTNVYYVYAGDFIQCSTGGEGGSTYKINSNGTVENV